MRNIYDNFVKKAKLYVGSNPTAPTIISYKISNKTAILTKLSVLWYNFVTKLFKKNS